VGQLGGFLGEAPASEVGYELGRGLLGREFKSRPLGPVYIRISSRLRKINIQLGYLLDA